MKIDIVSIFPGYFDVVELSLLGKAAKSKLVDVTVHDLRDATTDVHKSVDDTPYGGGAGMVMSPEPWGTMLDRILREDSWLVVPSPAGQLFSQSLAVEFLWHPTWFLPAGAMRGSTREWWSTIARRTAFWRSVSGTMSSTAVRWQCSR